MKLRKIYSLKKELGAMLLAGVMVLGGPGMAACQASEGLPDEEVLWEEMGPQEEIAEPESELEEADLPEWEEITETALEETALFEDGELWSEDPEAFDLIEDEEVVHASSLSVPETFDSLWVNPLYESVIDAQALCPQPWEIEQSRGLMQEMAEETASRLDEALGLEQTVQEADFYGADASLQEVPLVDADAQETVRFDIEEKLEGQGYFTSAARLAEEMRAHFKRRDVTFTLKIAGDLTGVRPTDYVKAAMNQAMEHTGVPNEGDYIRYQIMGNYSVYSKYTYYQTTFYIVTFNMGYYTTAEQESEMDARVRTILQRIYRSTDSADARVKAAYMYVCDHVAYDWWSYLAWKNTGKTSDYTMYTGYGALVKGSAVCQGYSVAMYRLLLEMGVDCRIIGGTGYTDGSATGEGHAWNIIRLGSRYYNADTTWDAGEQFSEYSYYLVGSASGFDTSHVRDAEYLTASFKSAYPINTGSYLSGTCALYGHQAVYMAAEAATCTRAGHAAGTRCAVCGAVLSGGEILRPAGHLYTGWSTARAATIYVPGRITRQCRVCGAADIEYVDRLTPTISLKPDKSSITLKRKKTKKIKVSYARGDKIRSFKSSRPKVVSVTKKGKLKALKKGKAKITVTLYSGKKKSLWVRVK